MLSDLASGLVTTAPPCCACKVAGAVAAINNAASKNCALHAMLEALGAVMKELTLICVSVDGHASYDAELIYTPCKFCKRRAILQL